jgi:hypothetical protein
MTMTDPKPTTRLYGATPPPWIDLSAIVADESIEEMEALADEYFKMAEALTFKARELAAQLAVVEEQERLAIERLGDLAGEVEDGVSNYLSDLTGSRGVRGVMSTVAEVLHPNWLERQPDQQAAMARAVRDELREHGKDTAAAD